MTEIVQLPPAGTLLPTPGQVPTPPNVKSPEIVKGALIVKAELLLLESVANATELVEPTTVLGNVNGFGEIVTEPPVEEPPPVPESESVCVPALSTTVTAPVRVPLAVGVNFTEIVQLPPAAIVLPTPGQVPVPPKAKFPEMVNGALMVTAEAVELVSVASSTLLVEPTVVLGNVSGFGEMWTVLVVGLAPVPVRVTFCGLPEAVSVTETDPVAVPAAVGLKVTLIVQLAPDARLVPQV